MSKYGVIFGPYFLVFEQGITPYLDTFHGVYIVLSFVKHIILTVVLQSYSKIS